MMFEVFQYEVKKVRKDSAKMKSTVPELIGRFATLEDARHLAEKYDHSVYIAIPAGAEHAENN